MKKQISTLWGVIIIVAVAVVLFGGAFAYQYFTKQNFAVVLPSQTHNEQLADENRQQNSGEQVMCTMDAMECPDGSYVGRTGPNCEFVCLTTTEAADTSNWKIYTNSEYGFEFKYPVELFDKFYGPSEDECSNRHPDIQKYSTRFIFEADQSDTASESISMNMTIFCTKLERNKVSEFMQDIALEGNNVIQKQIGDRIAYQTTAYSALSADESLHTFVDMGNTTLQISFYNPNVDEKTVNTILSTFKFTK